MSSSMVDFQHVSSACALQQTSDGTGKELLKCTLLRLVEVTSGELEKLWQLRQEFWEFQFGADGYIFLVSKRIELNAL